MVRSRRGRRWATRLVLPASLAVLIAGCGQPKAPAAPTGTGQLLVGRAERLPPAALPPSRLTAAEDAFGLALFRRVCAPAPNANLLLSPESAAEALGMLYAGARGETAAAVGRLLRLPAWRPGLVAALHRHNAQLSGLRQLSISDHLFEQAGVRPGQRALDDLRTAYRAGLWTVDFRTEPATTNQINAVVAHATHGLVRTLFPAPLPTSTRAVLSNTVYLKAGWQQAFPATSAGRFHTGNGGVVQVPMMSSAGPVASYRQAAGWQSATLPYAGGGLAAVGLLPPAHAASCAVPRPAQWTALTAGTSIRSTGVRLPRLRLSQAWDSLQTPLAAMGLPLSGDYSGLGPRDSQISEIVQRDTMDVTAAGTTAAAATGVAVGAAERVSPAAMLTFDRPFLLLLEDTATHAPLFLAWVTDPAEQ
jgi:serine protease inhibitor